MANKRISELTAITGANLADADLLVVVDVSDTTMASSGTNKKITMAELAKDSALTDNLVAKSTLTTTGDILTRDASAPTRITRADLAADTAFSSRYKPLASDSVFIPANDLHATTGTASMGTLGNATNAYSRAPVRVFVSASDTIAWVWAEMPLAWATFDIFVWWSNAGTGSGNVRFACAGDAFADNETTDADVSTLATFSTVAAPARYVTKRSKLNGSAIAADSGELLRVLVMRNGSSGSDTLANDIGVIGVELVRVS